MVLSIKGIIITRPWGPTPSYGELKVEKECNKHKMLGKNTKKVFYVFRVGYLKVWGTVLNR